MHKNYKLNASINHALCSQYQQLTALASITQHYDIPVQQPKKFFNPYKVPKCNNPLTERSRKHRLMEQRNTQIEKSNRILFQKIRKIKLKNLYHSQRKIEPYHQKQEHFSNNTTKKPKNDYQLPFINDERKISSRFSSSTISNKILSMNSTKSCLKNILEDRTTFVQQYFNNLDNNKKEKQSAKQIAFFQSQNGWKVRVLNVGEESVLLVGKKGRNQLTKKYTYAKVKHKIQNNLQEWVKQKFSFQL